MFGNTGGVLIAEAPVEPATPLCDVTFCVLDLETTGTSDEVDEIVEVGAVKVRGGEQIGTFQTMVRHPFAPTGELPPIGAVLPSLLEFVRGTVVVGHNVRFDLRFLNAALWRSGHDVVLDPELAVDTMHLARRLLRDDADDCRLGTLAERFGFSERPTHRALADASATVELLHLIIERSTHYGVFDLRDLARLPSLMRHRHRGKLAFTSGLPRAPGVARLLDRYDRPLHVVPADDLRDEVRELFQVVPGVRAVPLQHLHRVEWVEAAHPVLRQVVALRWSRELTGRRAVAHLRRAATGARRFSVTADADARGVLAGPVPLAVARAAVAELAASGCGDAFERALAGDEPADALPPAVAAVVAGHRAMARARSHRGTLLVDGAGVTVHDGRVVDVVVDGRSCAGQLPPAAAAADELGLIDEWLRRQPGCEMRDS
jgi:DNA polymerase-3 subunit epsilon